MALLIMLASCSCTIVSSPHSNAVVADSNAPEQVTPSASKPNHAYLTVDLQCTNYIKTQWGTEIGKWGLCPVSSPAWVRGPFPPKLNEQGESFIVDKVNRRILKYSGSGDETPQVISISSYMTDDVCKYDFWGNVGVSRDKLFFLFSAWRDGRAVDRLAVLSAKGHEQKVIDLELYYPLHSPYVNSLIPDRKGGVYLLLPPAGVVHFDAEFRSEFKYLGADDISLYENLVVGWDGNLYTYNVERDALNNWGADNRFFIPSESLGWTAGIISATQIASPTYTRLLGADAQGRLYFSTTERGVERLFVRVSASGDQKIIAVVPDEWRSSFYGSELAPDGSLYDIIYDDDNPSVNPKIIKCMFDQEQTMTSTP